MIRRSIRYYQNFEGEERLRLMLAARYRGDETESDRLEKAARPTPLRLLDYALPQQALFQVLIQA